MANRMYFIATPNDKKLYKEEFAEFKYYSGFAVSQKQKCINSFHESIREINDKYKILEVSTKSVDSIGVRLSAFNLKFLDVVSGKEYNLENIFQSSKVFKYDGPFRDLLNVHPKDAKRDERLKTSGDLVTFNYNNINWDLEPKTMFYDWIYIKALSRDEELSEEIMKYNVFTDIEFNHTKSINCQARAAAIFVSLKTKGILDEYLKDKNKFRSIYEYDVIEEQISFI